MAHTPIQEVPREIPSSRFSRRRFLAGTGAAVGAGALGRAPGAIRQQVRELQVWHTEVEPQTVKTIQDTSIAEFEKKFPGFKVKQQALGWGDLNTKLLAALAAGSPADLTHLNPLMTASLYRKNLLLDLEAGELLLELRDRGVLDRLHGLRLDFSVPDLDLTH